MKYMADHKLFLVITTTCHFVAAYGLKPWELV